MTYTELQVTSNFSFLRGASHPDELMAQAKAYGYRALAITDRNSLAGVVRAHVAARENGIRLIVGCRLDLQDGTTLLAYPTDRAAYARLSELLTVGKRRAPKGECFLGLPDVYAHADGLKFILVPPEKPWKNFKRTIEALRENLGRTLYLAASHLYDGGDAKRIALLALLARETRVPLIATNDVHYHRPNRRELQDVLTCIREKCTIGTAGYRLFANAERHLKPPKEIARIFKDYPDAVKRTQEIVDACTFSLEELRYEYPHEITGGGRSPQEELARLVWRGAAERFPKGVPDNIKATLETELAFIEGVAYAPYFLTVHDIVRFARSREKPILCQGRGSAANSVVCYCLGITSVDPVEVDLLFERFISSARNEPPDIDVDFEHERREEVMQYIYEKYGRERAGIVATVIEYRRKGALRDVGKAMGLSVDVIERLSKGIREFSSEWYDEETIRAQGLDPADPHLRKTIALAGDLLGFPRHLSQHTGGFVITRGKLSELCPVLNAAMEGRTCIEWNKDDIDALGILKIDVLALGMLTCIRKCFDLLERHYARSMTLATVPRDDADTYDMICKADTLGVFQIESRAQMSMLPRLKPRCFYDLVIEVAIIRPGPIQGDMIHPYLRRRNGVETLEYPGPELEHILKKTLGVPLFQEQAMKIAMVAANFTPAEAESLRRSMATFKFSGRVQEYKDKLIKGMIANGYSETFVDNIYKMLEGFGSYGFPESHAASFALLVYASCWLKCHYPDAFACALLNSQPMGFYAPAQIVRDAREHGVDVRPVDVNHSQWDCTLEGGALRLGFRQVKGLQRGGMERLAAARGDGYCDIAALRQKARLSLATLELLARADAFRSLGLDRRRALWEVTALTDRPAALFCDVPQDGIIEDEAELPAMTMGEHVVQDYAATSLSLKAHPVGFVRGRLNKMRAVSCETLPRLKDGTNLKLAGLVLCRQHPMTAKGVLFVTLEDETGTANLVVFKNVFKEFQKTLLIARFLMVEGKLERESGVTHIIARRFCDLSPWIRDLSNMGETALPLFEAAGDRSPELALPKPREFR
ncbi:MAG: error-prone DNA polymerase [Alphaproteobacteria bacterium]|nr:error-prone DNA polymerase [Alphaproteobacteria bacterium]